MYGRILSARQVKTQTYDRNKLYKYHKVTAILLDKSPEQMYYIRRAEVRSLKITTGEE